MLCRKRTLEREGATPALRAVALDALAALALSPAGRNKLRVHEEGLLSLAMSDRAAAEAPVMLALKRMATARTT